MKQNDKKEQFIIMRADGHSYSTIAKELGISKSTCTAWNGKLKEQIAELEDERTQELKRKYRVTKAGYIENLGATLDKIDQAIEQADLSTVPADKLLKLKLDYTEKLKTEITPQEVVEQSYNAEERAVEATLIYSRLRAGTITAQQAKAELHILEGINKAQEVSENQFKVIIVGEENLED